MSRVSGRQLLERLQLAAGRPDPDASDSFLLVEDAGSLALQHPGFPTGLEPVDLADILELGRRGDLSLDDERTPRHVQLVSLRRGASLLGGAPQPRNLDAFLSHAGEDSGTARDIALGLGQAGFGVWYDRFELKVGDRTLDRIKEGLAQAQFGILLVSEPFLTKHWTRFETSILQEAAIEGRGGLLPVWHGVSQEQVRRHDVTLAGVWALNTRNGLSSVVAGLAQAMIGPNQTVAVVPSWEAPVHRFLAGLGELTLGPDGPVFTIWEAIVQLPAARFPLFIVGHTYSRPDLLTHAMLALGGEGERVGRLAVGEDGMKTVDEMIRAEGGDPGVFRA